MPKAKKRKKKREREAKNVHTRTDTRSHPHADRHGHYALRMLVCTDLRKAWESDILPRPLLTSARPFPACPSLLVPSLWDCLLPCVRSTLVVVARLRLLATMAAEGCTRAPAARFSSARNISQALLLSTIASAASAAVCCAAKKKKKRKIEERAGPEIVVGCVCNEAKTRKAPQQHAVAAVFFFFFRSLLFSTSCVLSFLSVFSAAFVCRTTNRLISVGSMFGNAHGEKS